MIPLLWALHAQAAVVPAPTNAAVEAAYKPRRIALLIGVQEYSDPALQGLRFATKDAVDLGKALQDPNVGGFDRVFVIAGQAATSRAAIKNVLKLATADLQRDDTFLVYMSGHGTLTLDAAHGSRLWFLPSDGRLDSPETTGIAVADLEADIHDLTARRRVLILDTCHNGRSGSKSLVTSPTQQLLSGFRGEPPAPRDVHEVSESEARLYAAQYWQPAMEDPELQNGVYTHYLLEGLTGSRSMSDLNRDGLVDVAEAHQYARDHTIARTGGIQVPRAEYRIVGREEIFLSGRTDARRAAERALITACDMLLSRAKLIVNGIPRGELPGVYDLAPGAYTIEIQDKSGITLVRRHMKVTAGTTVSVEDLVDHREPSIGVLAGASYLGGNDGWAPANGSLELLWARPLIRTPSWLRPDLHLSVDVGNGWLPDNPGEAQSITTGRFNLGATLAYDASPVYFGPYVDLSLPFRATGPAYEQYVGTQGGLALGLEVPVGRALHLTARAEGFGALLPDYENSLAPAWGAALRVGATTAY